MGDKLGGSSSSSSMPLLTKGQRANLKAINQMVAGMLGKGGPVFQGQRVAGLDPLEQQAMDYYSETGFGQGLDQIGKASDFFEGQMNQQYDPGQTEDEFNRMAGIPAMRNWQKNIVPGISELFAGKNATRSGAFGKNLAEAGASLQGDLASDLAKMQFSERNRMTQNRFAGATGLSNLALMPQQLLQPLMGMGGISRGIQQNRLGQEHAKFLEGLPANNKLLFQLLGPALQTQAFQSVVNQTGGAGGMLGALGGGFLGSETGSGALMGGLGKLGGMFDFGTGGGGGMSNPLASVGGGGSTPSFGLDASRLMGSW